MQVKESSLVSKNPELQQVPILIVTSDIDSGRSAALFLLQGGSEVRIVGSGERALNVMCEFRPRVVVTDLVLPHMSGLVLAREIKSRSATRNTIVVALSPFKSTQVERLAAEAGCAAFVRTPLDHDTFPTIVAALLAACS